MADDQARPIHSWAVADDPTSAQGVDPHAPKCIACGRYHGGVNQGALCLEHEIRRLRAAAVAREPASVLEATAVLLRLARYFGRASKHLSDPGSRDAAEAAASDVARAAMSLETRFGFGTQARALAGLSHPVEPQKGEHR
jgi:hypothetical protein